MSLTKPAEGQAGQEEIGRSASYGDVLDVVEVGRVRVTRRYGCVRRDQFELKTEGPFPESLRESLARRGPLTERGPSLWVLDLPGAYQLTVAPRAGRALLLPRLSMERTSQKQAALEIASEIDRVVSPGST